MARLADPGPLGCYDDAARRCADVTTLAAMAGDGGRWLAIRLSDGGSDGAVYDTRAEAIRHQLHESQCAYVRVQEMTVAEAATFLTFARRAYDAGFRLCDPDDERAPSSPILTLPRT